MALRYASHGLLFVPYRSTSCPLFTDTLTAGWEIPILSTNDVVSLSPHVLQEEKHQIINVPFLPFFDDECSTPLIYCMSNHMDMIKKRICCPFTKLIFFLSQLQQVSS